MLLLTCKSTAFAPLRQEETIGWFGNHKVTFAGIQTFADFTIILV